jgi:DNA-binding transcriptional ArsR family regulator
VAGVPEKDAIEGVVSKPNRLAIVKLIGAEGEVSFKELKASLNLGVGTLYYHLDGLAKLVAQNQSKQYVLTEAGARVFDAVKSVDSGLPARARKLSPGAAGVVREILLLESHVERLSSDPFSNLNVFLGILLVGGLLSATARIEPAIFFFRSAGLAVTTGLIAYLVSWLVIFLVCATLPALLWKGQRNLLGVAVASAFSLLPITFAVFLDVARVVFRIRILDSLYASPYSIVFQILLVVWAAYILTLSLRSAVNLNLEKAMVITLIVILINLGYLWLRPAAFPPIR